MPTFVLERYNWRRVGPAAWLRLPGENALAAFDTADAAHTRAAELEAEARAVVGHPFRCGGSLRELTTLPGFAFQDWLSDVGIDPPDPDPDGSLPWLAWADLYSGEWSKSQLEHVWEGANRVRFHRVRERTAAQLHAVVRVRWSPPMNDSNYEPDTEGGMPCGLWHDRAAAERDRDRKQPFAADEVAGGMEMAGESRFHLDPRRRVVAAEPFAEVVPPPPADVRAVTHCEVVEIERGDDAAEPLGAWAFVVLRQGWDNEDDPECGPGHFDNDNNYDYGARKGGVLVRAFRLQEDAERLRDELEAEYRGLANPFRFDLPRVPVGSDDNALVCEWFASLGLTPPAITAAFSSDYFSRRRLYAAWWDRSADCLTAGQHAAIWEWVAAARFHEVREVPVGDGQELSPRRVRTLYYVRATNWIPDGGPNVNPHRFLGAFADRDRAEDVRADADRRARTNQTPMPWDRSGSEPNAWEEFSSWAKPDMRRHFVEHGLITEAEADNFVPNAYWWDDLRPRLRPAQAAAFWEVLDRVRLYEILPLETEVPS